MAQEKVEGGTPKATPESKRELVIRIPHKDIPFWIMMILSAILSIYSLLRTSSLP